MHRAVKPSTAAQKTVVQDIGQADDFYIMLLGETGSGKSTLLNMLVNFYRGLPKSRTALPDVRELKLVVPTKYLKATEPEGKQHSERDATDRTKSQSTKCVEYVFHYEALSGKHVKVHILDTPGLSDTEGADDEHLDKILEAAASLPFLSAIILVANGSVPRETMNIKNVFTLLRGNMPDAVLDNTLAVFTNCNSLTRNLEPKILPMRIAKKHQFYTDNSAFSTDPQRYANADEDELAGLHVAWAASMRTLQKISELVITLSAASSAAFTDMRNLREELKTKMAVTLTELRNMQQLEDAVQQAEVVLQGAAQDSQKYKDFVQTSTVEETQIVDAPYHSTLCNVCQTVCHDHCNLEELSDAGDAQFAGCIVMQGQGNTCTRCVAKCGIPNHYHARKTVQKVQKTVENILDDIKAKYEAAQDQLGGAQASASQALSDLDMIKLVQQQKLDELKQLCRAIKQIASQFNLTNELNVSLNGLVMEAKQLKSTQARESADRAIKELKAFISQLSEEPSPVVLNLADLDLDDAPSNGDERKPRRVQLEQIQGLASRTPASGPARLKVLQGAAGAAVTANEFRPILESEEELAAESNQVQKLSQEVARLEKKLQEVMEYKKLVNAPQRVAATPRAAGMATFAQDLLTAKKQALLDEIAVQEEATENGSHVWAAQSAALAQAAAHGYNSAPHASNSQGLEVVSKKWGQTPSPADRHVTAQQSFARVPMTPSVPQQYNMPSEAAVVPQQWSAPPKATKLPQQYSVQADAAPQYCSMPYTPGAKPGLVGAQEIHVSAGHMTEASVDGQSSTFVVPASKVGHLVRLVCNNGKLKTSIADATGCRITIPPMEQWDEHDGAVLLIEGQQAAIAAQLIFDKLQ